MNIEETFLERVERLKLVAGEADKDVEMINPFLDGHALFEQCKISEESLQSKPENIFLIQDGERAKSFADQKSLIVISGGSKVGKGRLIEVFSIAGLKGKYGPIRSRLGNRKIAILQSDDHAYNLGLMASRISREVGLEGRFHDQLIILAIRSYSIAEKFAVLDALLEKHPDLGVIVFDLVWEWINSVNDEIGSKRFIDELITIAEKYSLLIIAVTHESKVSHSPKGHQGSHLVHKAQTAFTIRKSRGKFILKADHCRGEELPAMVFEYDGASYIFHDPLKFQNEKPQRKQDILDVSDSIHLKILNKLSTEKNEWAATELRSRLRREFADIDFPIGENLTKRIMQHYKTKNWIQSKGRGYEFGNGTENAL